MAMTYGQRLAEEQQPVKERLRGKQQRAAELRAKLAQKKLQVQSLQMQLKAVGVQGTSVVPGSITAGAGIGASASSELRSLLEWIAESVDLTRQVNFECGASGAGVVVAGRRVLLQKMSALPLAGTPGPQLQLSIPLELQADILQLITSIRSQGGKVGEVELARIAEAWEMVGAEMCSASTGQQEPAIFLVRREEAERSLQPPSNVEAATTPNNKNSQQQQQPQEEESLGVDAPPPARAIVVAQWPSIDFAKVAAASIFNADLHFQRLAAAPAKADGGTTSASNKGASPEGEKAKANAHNGYQPRYPQQLLQQQSLQQQQQQQQPTQQLASQSQQQQQQQQQRQVQHIVTRTSTVAIARAGGSQVVTRRTILQMPLQSSPQRLQVMPKQAWPLNSSSSSGDSSPTHCQGQSQTQSVPATSTSPSASPKRLQKLGSPAGLGTANSNRNQSTASFTSCDRSSGSSDNDNDDDDEIQSVIIGQETDDQDTTPVDMDLSSTGDDGCASAATCRSRLEYRFLKEFEQKQNNKRKDEECEKEEEVEVGATINMSFDTQPPVASVQKRPCPEESAATEDDIVRDTLVAIEGHQKKKRELQRDHEPQPQAQDGCIRGAPVVIHQLTKVEMDETIVHPVELAGNNASTTLKVRVGDRVVVQYRGRWLSGVLQHLDSDNNIANVKCDGDVAGVITIVALSSVWPSAPPPEDANPRSAGSPPHRHFFRHARAKTVG